MNIAVLGSSGQIGSAIKLLSKNKNKFFFYFLHRKKINYFNTNILNNFLKKKKINVIINCCAFTNVNEATLKPNQALKVNFQFVKKLDNLCSLHKISLIHFSTDYVFNGKSKLPYSENFKTNPLNVYGKTKLLADNFLLKSKNKIVIIRTSWVFSYKSNSFVKKIIDKSKNQKEIDVVCDQIGCPTYAKDIAQTVVKILDDKVLKKVNKPLLINFSNKNKTSWFGFAKKILKIIKSKSLAIPVKTKKIKNYTIRPKFSVLNTSKIKKFLNFNIRSWQKALIECIEKKV